MPSSWRELAEWDWVRIGNGDRLHAVARLTNEDTVEDDWYGVGFTECGLGGDLHIPGLFSRMSVPRCIRCCERTGMPQGDQSPKNIDECRPIAELRILALASREQRDTKEDR